MSNQTGPVLKKVPFIIGYLALLGLAAYLCVSHYAARAPMNAGEMAVVVLCGIGGACLGIAPYVMEYRAAVRFAEAGILFSAVEQIQNVEDLAENIGRATAQWQGVQEHAAKTEAAAREIAGRMASEAAAFTEFMQKANDGEKAKLRLEVDKFRRSEGEWLQVAVRMLDHTWALHQAALRSGQAGLISQLGLFQNACHDAARRVGLVPFVAAPDEIFDPHRHQVQDAAEVPPAGAPVRETMVCGYTFQGQLLRPALVALQVASAPAAELPPQPVVEPAPEPKAVAAAVETKIEEPTLL